MTVRASDASGRSDGRTDRNVTVTVTNRNPVFDDGDSSVSYAEGGTASAETYSASDPGGGTVSWSLPATTFATDRSDFSISSSGELSFDSTPNYESPHDSEPNNVYKVTVRASDASGRSDGRTDRNVTVTVTNRNPVFDDGDSSVNYAEGGTASVETYSASDPGGGTVSWSLPATTFATDRSDFSISSSGVLSFDSTPNYESPHDSEPNNVYKVTVRASDASGRSDGRTDRNVTVTVTDVNEAPVSSAIGDRALAHSVASLEIDLSNYFSDPDTNDTLSYSASSSDTGVATESVSGSDLTITRKAPGVTTVTVTAADRSAGHADRLTATEGFTVTVEDPTPAKVTGLTGMPGSVRGTIDLDWDPADGADDYEVAQWRRLLGPLYHWVVLDDSEVTIDLGNTSAEVTGLEGGETYRHRVRGVRGVGSDRVEGPWSDHVDTTLTLPDKVQGLSGAPGANHGEIALDWDVADGATGYQVRQRKPRSSPLPDTWIELPAEGFGVAIVGTTAVVSNLDPDKSYVYQVRGTNVHGDGEWSDATGEIAVRDESPAKPQGLVRGNMIGNRGIFLRWLVAADASGYEVDIDPMEASQTKISSLSASHEKAEVTGLTPGTNYTFRVRAWKPHGASPLYSPWSDTVEREAPTPSLWLGHQSDHTVKYALGTIGNSIIQNSISPAAAAWNSKLAGLGKGLTICLNCGTSNSDGFTVTIKTVNNKNDAGGNANFDPDEGCARSRACAKPDLSSLSDLDGSPGPGAHLGNMHIIFEDPPMRATQDSSGMWKNKEYMWTAIESLDGTKVTSIPSRDVYYIYVGRVMIHEFGHTLGLPDFPGDTTGLASLPAIMNMSYEIEDEDIEQLKAIYLLHNSH